MPKNMNKVTTSADKTSGKQSLAWMLLLLFLPLLLLLLLLCVLYTSDAADE